MKALKWIALGAVALVVLLAAVLAWLLSSFDPNAYKAQVSEAVQKATGRTLQIGGPITLKVWPRLHVAMSDVQLSERGRPQAFASAGELELAVEVLPLLHRELVIDKVKAAKVRVQYTRGKDGRSNIDDLLTPSSPSSQTAGPRFDIQDIDLRDLAVQVQDAQAGTDLTLQLTRFRSGRLADQVRTPLDLAGEVTGRAPRVALKFAANGTLRLDLAAGRYELADATLSAAGNGPQFTQLDARLTGSLAYDSAQRALSAQALQLQGTGTLQLPGDAGRPRTLALRTFALKAPRLAVALATRTLSGQQIDGKAEGTLDAEPLALSLQAATLDADLARPTVTATALKSSLTATLAGVRIDALTLAAGSAKYDGPSRNVAVQGLDASARGSRAGNGFEASVSLPTLAVTPDSARGSQLAGKFRLDGATPMQGTISSGAISGNMTALRIGDIRLAGSGTQGARSAQVELSTDLLADLLALRVDLSRLALRVQASDPAQPFKRLSLAAQGQAAWDAGARRGSATLKGQLDDSAFTLAGSAALGAPTTVRVDATLDAIDLDRYLPPPPKTEAKPANTGDTAVDLSFVRDVVVTGSLRVGSVQWQGKRLQDVRVQAQGERGRLRLPVTSLKAYGGSIDGSATIEAPAGGPQRIALRQKLVGIDVQQAMKDFAGKDLLEGRGTVDLDVTASGATLGQIKKSLDGTASIVIRDGAVKGINLARTLREAKAALSLSSDQRVEASKTEKTDFSELTATLRIAKGVASNDDLSIKSPYLRIGGEGKVDIGNDSLDYVVKAAVVNTAQGQDAGDLSRLKNLTIPVRLSGPFDALRYNIQWSQVASAALKGKVDAAKDSAKARLEEQLRGKLGLPAPAQGASQPAQQKSVQEQLKDKARDQLKGLFGK